MKTNVSEDRLLIISDLHLGNPFCDTKRQITEFLSYVASSDYSLCINGDGLEIAQGSTDKLVHQAPEVIFQLSRIYQSGRKVYYVVGNHDIIFEHFVEAWGGIHIVPFLNVVSGDKRIRIEHGHLYDPFFVGYPNLYEFATRFSGYFLKVYPGFYNLLIQFHRLRGRLTRRRAKGIVGERPAYIEAVRELARRGFDVISFGHTHHAGTVDLGGGKLYVNSGSWMVRPSYVQIDQGKVELKRWIT